MFLFQHLKKFGIKIHYKSIDKLMNIRKHLNRFFLCLLFLNFFSNSILFSQVFTIEGISGIELNEYGQDSVVNVSNNFSVFGIDFTPDSLVLSYKEQEKEISISGKSTIRFENEQIAAQLDLTISNQNIGGWDVIAVTNMSSMFASSSFNQDISSWDVSNVTNMRAMFFRNTDFNVDIGGWEVGNVNEMSSMFAQSSFNQNLSAWCVSQIPNEPENFSTDAPLEQNNKPIWGTCPSN